LGFEFVRTSKPGDRLGVSYERKVLWSKSLAFEIAA
jgi:hypothetical protein